MNLGIDWMIAIFKTEILNIKIFKTMIFKLAMENLERQNLARAETYIMKRCNVKWTRMVKKYFGLSEFEIFNVMKNVIGKQCD